MFHFRRVATHIGPTGSVPHVLADVVHNMRDACDLDVQLWHLVAGGAVGTSMISIWAPRVSDVTALFDDLRGDRVARDLHDEATATLHAPGRDSFETVLAGDPRLVRSRPGWLQVRSEGTALRRPGTWTGDPVEAATAIGHPAVAVREFYGDENRVAWITTAPDHAALDERRSLLAADAECSAADAALARHLTPEGRTVTLWRRSV
jgi:hypothetical protein